MTLHPRSSWAYQAIRSPAMIGVIVAFAYLCFQAAIAAPPPIVNSNQGVTLLYQNNLNFTDDVNHKSFLFLDGSNTYEQASAACASYSESLVSPALLRSSQNDLSYQINYLLYSRKINPETGIWVQGGYITPKSGLFVQPVRDRNAHYAVLCTQSDTSTLIANNTVTPQNSVSVQSRGNTFVGYRNKKSFRFLGIPYADPFDRWSYSKPYSGTRQVIQANKYGAQCFTSPSPPNSGYSEDCLFLNVFTPYLPHGNGPSTNLKPVAVWVTGGGYTSGSGSDPTFDGSNMASRGDTVLVTVNYRLGTIGFLNIPGTDITGNYGFADVITALQWVQQNIANFGGDPNKVTVFGQSAGAGTTRALLGSEPAKGLFHAAIPESNLGGYDYGTSYSEYYTPEEEYNVAGKAIVTDVGCSSASDVASCLQGIDPLTLSNLNDVARYLTVDGHYIKESHIDVTGNNYLADVPLIYGSARDDGAPFIGYPTTDDLASSVEQLLSFNSSFTNSIISSGLFPEPGSSIADVYNVSSRLATDVIFRCIDQATINSAVKHRKLSKVFYYQFDRTYNGYDPNNVCFAPLTASHPYGDPSLPYYRCHSGELYYVFGTLNEFGLHFRDEYDLPFNQLIMDYWTSFFRTGNPNPDPNYLKARGYTGTLQVASANGQWPQFNAQSPEIFLLDAPRATKSPFVDLEQCQFLGLPLNFYE
ncbi:hypothetical protein AWJ20_1027 [Sugiyamaella lignohabitans]|uniref:Carboxylic ester hydrolase n=1 Tax=Sugiyamaella lignohabitans TaxID=796027 RepID=A0A161HL79_9ASCO|nr:uncharacterized protein AWJ20_1027 [Sugiyamaella lignohabitans]ANB12758.1 hypothetical protein AWJ20_1027 [Sugiyamaella lignohabitans]